MKIKLTTTNMLIGGGVVLAVLWYRQKSAAQASAATAMRLAAARTVHPIVSTTPRPLPFAPVSNAPMPGLQRPGYLPGPGPRYL